MGKSMSEGMDKILEKIELMAKSGKMEESVGPALKPMGIVGGEGKATEDGEEQLEALSAGVVDKIAQSMVGNPKTAALMGRLVGSDNEPEMSAELRRELMAFLFMFFSGHGLAGSGAGKARKAIAGMLHR